MATLGYATDALYSQGVACLIQQDHVRLLDLYGPCVDRSITIGKLLEESDLASTHHDYNSVKLLSYHSNVLVVQYEQREGFCWLLAVDVSDIEHPRQRIKAERVRNTNKLFVRQNKDYLFYGTHSAFGSWCGHRYREWLIQGISISGRPFLISDDENEGHVKQSQRSSPIQLHGFAGSEVGVTASFVFHEDHFYAITNCDAFDVIEVDFTSFYKCIRFPIERAQQSTCLAARRIYRRQHAEGPLNDGWNSLNLQVDERTQQLLVVEGRAEWPLASGSLSRGFYVQKIDMDDQELELVRQTGPAENPLSKIPDAETKYCETPAMPPEHSHMEARNRAQNASDDVYATCPTLSRCKYRGYDFTCMASVELVEYPCNCRTFGSYCLQLRAASRKPNPFMHLQQEHRLGSRGKQKALGPHDVLLDYSVPEAYRYSPISVWPKDDTRLHEIMNLPTQLEGGYGVDLKAWMDERSIVYFIHSGGVGKVIWLNFDGDAPIRNYAEISSYNLLQPRGRSTRQRSDPEHLRKLSPLRQPFEYARFNPDEAKAAVFESTCDLDDIPDAQQLSTLVLEDWFDMLDRR